MSAKNKKIVKGPSKFDLMIALFHWEGDRVRFVLVDRTEQSMFITSVERDDAHDESGEEWNFTGANGDASVGAPKFRGHYNTRTRKGILIEVENKYFDE